MPDTVEVRRTPRVFVLDDGREALEHCAEVQSRLAMQLRSWAHTHTNTLTTCTTHGTDCSTVNMKPDAAKPTEEVLSV